VTKKINLTIISTILALSVPNALARESVDAFQWPDGKRAAVNLAYDDALNSQLDNAIPALDRYGFKGSFYLVMAAPAVKQRMEEWRSIARNGHELGNHSLFHPCSAALPGRDWVEPWNDLDGMSVEEVRQHIVLTNTMLFAIDGKSERTYAATCGDVLAGGKPYLPAVIPELVAIKAHTDGVTASMKLVDPYSVSVITPSEVSGNELIAMVEQAAALGTMVNFTFHGIGGDHLQVSTLAHDELLQYLSDNSDIYWVDTFLNIMKYVKQQKAISPDS
jgi:peptidoglycan/xylan/chitin deacetylase (PgdA/CDA1 family)